MKLKEIAKKLISAIVVLALFISPLSDYLPILGEGMKVSAASGHHGWTGSSGDYGYARCADNDEALNEVKDAMKKTCSASEMARFEKILSEFPLSGYFNSSKTTACNGHDKDIKSFYDDETKTTIDNSSFVAYGDAATKFIDAKQCAFFAIYCFYRFYGKQVAEKSINFENGYSASDLKKALENNKIRAGAHFRWNKGGSSQHSLCYLTKDDTYMYFIDANFGCGSNDAKEPNCKIHLKKITYSEFQKHYPTRFYIYYSETSKFDTLDLTTTPLNLGDQFLAAIQSSDGTKALTVDSNNNVSIQKYVGTPNQTWMFTRTDGNYYEIKNPATGKCLDAANGGNSDYTNIQVWEDNDTSSQRYGIYGSQNSYVMRVKHSSVLVVDAGAARNNVNLYTYSPNIAAQKFRIFCLFDNISVKNITSTNALVAAKFHKPSEAKALAYDISVSTSSNMQNAVTHSCKPSSTNVGNTSRDITFDFVKEYNHYLSANTTYYYRLIGKYDINGSTVTYTSPVYSFKTLANSADPSVTVKTSTSRYKNNITNTNAIIYGEVDKPTSYPVTKIGIRVRVDGGTYENGWSKYDNTSRTYVGSTYMCPCYDMNKELNLTLTHSTKYFYKFYAVVNGKEYWSPEGSFTTTGSHSFGPWVTTKPATCTESGVQTRSCSCGKTETQTIPATGHSYEAWSTTKAPTCTDSGIQTRSCTKCGDTQTQTVAAKGHSYSSSWTVDVQPTCTADGRKSHHCTICGAKKDITSIPALGHNYKVTVVAPTAYSDGYTLHQCTRCPYNYKDNYTSKKLYGDVDGNGKINALDNMTLAKYIANGKGSTVIDIADMNGDGKVNALDNMILAQNIANGNV